MTERTVTVPNRLGIHARPAALIVRRASVFRSDVRLRFGSDEVNAKSIMGVMTLAAGKDSQLVVIAEGKDEKDAVDAICELVSSGFGED
ncbi:HPr family phosphocarrier protein [Candidatus Fermentibacterales bacterium]|nr:HPr family phosphocarrier protein [Candidatus Fermentibacterales bacterium]